MKNQSDTLAQSSVDKPQHVSQVAWNAIEQALAERDRLKAINAELLEVLQTIANQSTGTDWTHEEAFKFCKESARAALLQRPS